MPTLKEQIMGLSPEALDIFRKQLPQRLKELGELERNTALEQLQRLPELQLGEFQPTPQPIARQPQTTQEAPQQQPEIPWWQHPLNWLRNVEQAAGTLLAAPFTPSVQGTENLPWWQRDEPSMRLGMSHLSKPNLYLDFRGHPKN